MRLFKRIDVGLQILLMAGALFQWLFTPADLLYGYLLLGGWQVLSFLIHLFVPDAFYAVKGRGTYGYALLLLTGLSLITFPVVIFFLPSALLWIIPALYALYYLWVCIKENDLLSRKALIHLK